MNCVESILAPGQYLLELKQCFDSPFAIHDERVCGIVVGPFFSVAYHSPYEWNRRITAECNRAWGYVKAADGKTEVRFIRGKGMLSPFWLVFFALLFAVVLIGMVIGETGGVIDLSGEMGMIWLFSAGISVVVCGITAFQSSITEQGEAGAGEITKLLQNPKEYFC